MEPTDLGDDTRGKRMRTTQGLQDWVTGGAEGVSKRKKGRIWREYAYVLYLEVFCLFCFVLFLFFELWLCAVEPDMEKAEFPPTKKDPVRVGL